MSPFSKESPLSKTEIANLCGICDTRKWGATTQIGKPKLKLCGAMRLGLADRTKSKITMVAVLASERTDQ